MPMAPGPAALPPYMPPAALASERMMGAVIHRVSGPQARFVSRSLQFADRVLGGLLQVMGMEGREAQLAPRQAGPFEWLFPRPWYEHPAQAAAARRPGRAPVSQ